MTIPKRRPGVRYEVNICGGGFDALKSHFNEWKHEPLIYRPERRMFEGKADVRPLGGETFGSTGARGSRCSARASRPMRMRSPRRCAMKAASCGS